MIGVIAVGEHGEDGEGSGGGFLAIISGESAFCGLGFGEELQASGIDAFDFWGDLGASVDGGVLGVEEGGEGDEVKNGSSEEVHWGLFGAVELLEIGLELVAKLLGPGAGIGGAGAFLDLTGAGFILAEDALGGFSGEGGGLVLIIFAGGFCFGDLGGDLLDHFGHFGGGFGLGGVVFIFVVWGDEEFDDRGLDGGDRGIGFGLAEITGGFIDEKLDFFEEGFDFGELGFFAEDAEGIAEVAFLVGEFFGICGVLGGGVFAGFEEIGLFADIVLGLGGANHGHDEFHHLGIGFLGFAFAFAGGFFFLELGGPFVELFAPEDGFADRFEAEIGANDFCEVVEFVDDLFFLHGFLDGLIFFVGDAFDEGFHIVGDAFDVFGGEFLAGSGVFKFELVGLAIFVGAKAEGGFGDGFDALGDFHFGGGGGAHAIKEVSGVEVFVFLVHLFGGLFEGGEGFLLIFFGFGGFFLEIGRFLGGLSEGIGGFIHGRGGLFLDGIFDLLPFGESAFGDFFIAEGVLHDGRHFFGEFLGSGLVGAFVGFGAFGIFGRFFGGFFVGGIGFGFGEIFTFFELAFFVANPVFELFEGFVHAFANIFGVFGEAENVDGVFGGFGGFAIGEIIGGVSGDFDHAVFGDILPSWGEVGIFGESFGFLASWGAIDFAFADRLGFFAVGANSPSEPSGLEAEVIGGIELEFKDFGGENGDTLIEAEQIDARFGVFGGGDFDRVGLSGFEAVLIRPAERGVAEDFGEGSEWGEEGIVVEIGGGIDVAAFHGGVLEMAASFAGEADTAAFEKLGFASLNHLVGRGIAEIIWESDLGGEFFEFGAIEGADGDFVGGVADAEGELAVTGLALDAKDGAVMVVEGSGGGGGGIQASGSGLGNPGGIFFEAASDFEGFAVWDDEFVGEIIERGEGVAFDGFPREEPAGEGVSGGEWGEDEGGGGEGEEDDGGEGPSSGGAGGYGFGEVKVSGFVGDLADGGAHEGWGDMGWEMGGIGEFDDALESIAEGFEMGLEDFPEFGGAASIPEPIVRPAFGEPSGEGGAGESEDGAGPAWGIAEAIEDKEEEESGEEADEATGDGGAGFELAESGFEIAELKEERIW